MSKKKIPEAVISRLVVYLREVTELNKLKIRAISSSELGDRTNLSDVQVRKDLGYFGQFGVSGAGYPISDLKESLERILGKNTIWNVAIVGVGHLGSALLAYSGFNKHGLNIVAGFDTDLRKAGKTLEGILIQPIDALPAMVKEKNISIGIITVPSREAQNVADLFVAAGVECILNFAPASLNVPEHVKVKDVDLSRELETLSYHLANRNG
ncbi:Redox-sensing transcriptional repressor rex [Candidatus Omnitrophus magneticus]|uniref:Redox-sensing transcriptional repressor Rex n=1 Tax=Candidatus Omnitrophus magneticus TaxID=1609969 RepID=A0A0F0CP31_9BACT|nr:Redox-sensing transcriptional repressor rex [Candidatus Omnitrophus magneticus]